MADIQKWAPRTMAAVRRRVGRNEVTDNVRRKSKRLVAAKEHPPACLPACHNLGIAAQGGGGGGTAGKVCQAAKCVMLHSALADRRVITSS